MLTCHTLQLLLGPGVAAPADVTDSDDGESVDERALIDHCRESLAHFKCPTSVEFREELSRTATGKLQKFKLRAPYWVGMEKQIN